MSISYDQAAGRYRVRIYRRGRRVVDERLPKGTSRQDAEARQAECVRNIYRSSRLGIKPKRLISEVVREYMERELPGLKAKAQWKSHMANLHRWIAGKSIEEIPDVAANYVKFNRGRLKPATINRRLAILKRMCNLAIELGWVDLDYGRKFCLLPENNQRKVRLENTFIPRLYAEIKDDEAKRWMLVAVMSGLRQGEIMALDQASIKDGRFFVRDSKSGESRYVPISESLIEALEWIPFRQHRRTLYGHYKAALERLGRPEVNFHDLRRTFASLLLNTGTRLDEVAQILGHKNIQTTRRYAYLDDEKAVEAVKRIKL